MLFIYFCVFFSEIRCLKIRYFKKQVHDFQRELTILKDPNTINENFAALYLADIAILGQPYIWLMTEYTEVCVVFVLVFLIYFKIALFLNSKLF